MKKKFAMSDLLIKYIDNYLNGVSKDTFLFKRASLKKRI